MAGGPNEVADSTAGWAKLQLASEAAAGRPREVVDGGAGQAAASRPHKVGWQTLQPHNGAWINQEEQ